MKKSKNDVSKPSSLKHVIDTKSSGPNDTQKMVKKQGGGVVTPMMGLGYIPSQPMKIS